MRTKVCGESGGVTEFCRTARGRCLPGGSTGAEARRERERGPWGRVFQAEGTARAQVLRRTCASMCGEPQGGSSWSTVGVLWERGRETRGKGGFALVESYVIKKVKCQIEMPFITCKVSGPRAAEYAWGVQTRGPKHRRKSVSTAEQPCEAVR